MAERILPEYPAVFGQEIKEAVFVALGAASVCWEDIGEGDRVFDSTRCEQIGHELMDLIIDFARRYPRPGDPGHHPHLHVAKHDPGERALVLRDLGKLLDALGLGDYARPQSPHEVMLMCIEEAQRLRTAQPASAERQQIKEALDKVADHYRNAGVFANCVIHDLREALEGTDG